MIINTVQEGKQSKTIDYIRNITKFLDSSQKYQQQSDSLIFSSSGSTPISKRDSKINDKVQLQEQYVSPYKQSSLSMRKIMQSKNKSVSLNKYITNVGPKDSVQIDNLNKVKRSPLKVRYKHIPPLIQLLEKNEVDKMKTEAKFIYQHHQKEKRGMTIIEKEQNWADFLLRQRRWQCQKDKNKMQARQRAVSFEVVEQKKVTSRKIQKISIEESIKQLKRKKIKLEQQLMEISEHYYSRNSSNSLAKRQKSPIKSESKNRIDGNIVCISTHQELQFLLKS